MPQEVQVDQTSGRCTTRESCTWIILKANHFVLALDFQGYWCHMFTLKWWLRFSTTKTTTWDSFTLQVILIGRILSSTVSVVSLVNKYDG